MSFDADGFLCGRQHIQARAWARFRREAAGLEELTPRMAELGGGGAGVAGRWWRGGNTPRAGDEAVPLGLRLWDS